LAVQRSRHANAGNMSMRHLVDTTNTANTNTTSTTNPSGSTNHPDPGHFRNQLSKNIVGNDQLVKLLGDIDATLGTR
jgi:hypothetical protein